MNKLLRPAARADLSEIDARILSEAYKAEPLPAGHHAISLAVKKVAKAKRHSETVAAPKSGKGKGSKSGKKVEQA
eukprot:4868393-Alexandrium_andersonii.AAC.1